MIVSPPPPQAAAFAVGQRYACKSKDPARQIEIVVGRVDEWPRGVKVVSVSLKNAAANTEISDIAHMPFDATALSAACPKLLGSDAPLSPNFEEGYRTWRGDNGGYYTISADEALDVAISTLTKGTRTK